MWNVNGTRRKQDQKNSEKKLPLLLFDISIVVIRKNLFQDQNQVDSGKTGFMQKQNQNQVDSPLSAVAAESWLN